MRKTTEIKNQRIRRQGRRSRDLGKRMPKAL